MSHSKMLVMGLALGLTASTLTGCGESIEHRLQRAQIALNSSKPDTALELAESILLEKPEWEDAQILKADAQIRLIQLEQARKTIESILNKSANNDAARRLMLKWVFFKLRNLLLQSDFAMSSDRKEEYAATMAIGKAQVEWFKSREKDLVDADMYMAQLMREDINRINLMINVQSQQVTRGDDVTAENTGVNTEKLESERAARRLDAIKLLENVLRADPRHFEAAQYLANLLVEDRRWPDLWDLANRLAKEENLPMDLSRTIVVSLVSMNEGFKPNADIVALGQKLQDRVASDRRSHPTWRLTQARLAMRNQDFDKAKPLLEGILADTPREVTPRYLKAYCHFMLKEHAQAREILAQLATDTRDPNVLKLYGQVLVDLDDLSLASEVLKRAIDLNPNDLATRHTFLLAQTKSHKLEQASEAIDDLYIKSPTNPEAIRFKIQYEQIRNRKEIVREVLATVEKIRPLTDEHIGILVDGYSFLQDIPSMARYAQELARRRPGDLRAQLQLARSMLMQNRDDEVKTFLDQLRGKYPESTNVDLLLGQLYLDRQSFDRAIALIQGVIDHEPGNNGARLSLARAYWGLAQFDEAMIQIDKVLEKEPANAIAHDMAARLYQLMGRRDKASEHLAQIDTSAVDENNTPALLAQLKIRQGQLDEAIEICNRALASGNSDPTIRQMLAAAYNEKKQPELAEQNLLGLIRMQANNAQVYTALARFYIDQKWIDKGLMEFVKLQSSNDTLARLAQANLLLAANRAEEAISLLQPIYEPLIKSRDIRALLVADALSRLQLITRKDFNLAASAYDPMIQADFQAQEAALRKTDLQRRAVFEKSAKDPQAAPAAHEEILNKYRQIAAKLGPDDKKVRYELVRRFLEYNKTEEAKALVDDWIKYQPNVPSIRQLQAEVLVRMNKSQEAITVLQDTSKQFPEEDLIRRQLATVHIGRKDFPAAEKVFLDHQGLDAMSRVSFLTDLGMMYVGLGLQEPAVAIFQRVEKEGSAKDPRVMLSMGKALTAMEQYPQAKAKLEQIPEYTPYYATAQIMLAQIEQRAGQIEQAKTRLETLARNPKTAAYATAELLRLNLRNRQAEDILQWSDRYLTIESLPADIRMRWLNVRILMADAKRDYGMLLSSLDRLAQISPNIPQVTTARLLVLIKDGKIEQARQLYLTMDRGGNEFAPLLGAALGEKITMDSRLAPMDKFVLAMCRGEVEQARAIIKEVPNLPGIYAGDLKLVTDRPDAGSTNMQLMFRQLAAAHLAYRANLPQLANDLAEEVVQKAPYLVLAYTTQTRALQDMDEQVDRVLTNLRKNLPESSLAMYVSTLEAGRVKDYQAAVNFMEKLKDKEPDNLQVRYALTQAYNLALMYDKAIVILQELNAQPGPFEAQVANDLAYLLAVHQPDKMAQAEALGRKALEMSGRSPAVADTHGWILHLHGKDQEAIKFLSYAIEHLNNIPDAHYHIGVVYAKLGNLPWAKYHLQVAARTKDSPVAADAAKALSELKI